MKTKNISFFLIIALFLSAESKGVTSKVQRVAAGASCIIRRAPHRLTAPMSQVAISESTQPRRVYSSLAESSKNQKMKRADWHASHFTKTQQNRYFSSKPLPGAGATLLIEAIQSGSKEKLYDLIRKGLVDINARYDNNDTILHIAARSGASFDIITLLIDAGADVHAQNRYVDTPLHVAAQYDNVEAVKALIFKKANPNTTDNQTGFWSLFRHLSFKPEGKTPLYIAQEKDKPSQKTLEIIQILEPLTDKSFWFVVTPEIALRRALLFNRAETVKHLLTEQKFSKKALNTALVDAAGYYSPAPTAEILAMLIDAGAEVRAKNSLEMTPLHRAALFGNLEAVKLFLTRKADPNALNHEGSTPLDLAKKDSTPSKSTLEIIRILEPLTKKRVRRPGVSMGVEDELALLIKTIKSGNATSLKQLLTQYKFSKNDLNSALIEAAQSSLAVRAEMLSDLIDAGADVNTKKKTPWHRTSLHYAAWYGNPWTVKLLLARGANPNILDNESKSALYLAQEEDVPSKETVAVIRLLEPVTEKSLWFVVTPEIMLRRAVKRGSKQGVRSVLEMEEGPFEAETEEEQTETQSKTKTEEKSKKAGPSAQQKKQRTKKFTGSQEELVKVWQQVRDKKTVYEILGVDQESSKKEIDMAYLDWVRKHHPDRYRDEELNKRADAVLKYLNEYLR